MPSTRENQVHGQYKNETLFQNQNKNGRYPIAENILWYVYI